MGLRPLYAFVLLEREKLSSSLIILNESQKAHAKAKGKLVAKGPDAQEDLEIGKTYLFGKYAGDWVNAKGTPVADPNEAEFYILEDEKLLCEVTDE